MKNEFITGLLNFGLGIFIGWFATDWAWDASDVKRDLSEATALKNASDEHARQLQEAQDMASLALIQVQAHEIALIESAERHQAELKRLKKEIPNVIKQDEKDSGHCYAGLGPGSLQLYAKALGYQGGD